MDNPNESEAELVDRRGREAATRAAEHDARIEAHRRAGTLVAGTALPPAPRIDGIMGSPRAGPGWGA